ncbi:hypothetical protein Hanom_Chr11g00980711 [Helianthus anomalus]
MGRGLGIKAQVTTPGGFEFRRGPLGGGFSPGVGLEGMVMILQGRMIRHLGATS